MTFFFFRAYQRITCSREVECVQPNELLNRLDSFRVQVAKALFFLVTVYNTFESSSSPKLSNGLYSKKYSTSHTLNDFVK